MLVSKKYHSPNFQKKIINVEFVVFHYTAQSLKESLKIFLSPGQSSVSCHLLIDEEGEVYELVDCWNGSCKKAFHAGRSSLIDSKGKKWEDFNNSSLGIELVNWNGNIFHFSENQYKSLFEVLLHLKNIYPILENPERIVGHEHIAGFRGKSDPGYLFDWKRLFKAVYPEKQEPKRIPILTKKQYQSLSFLKDPQTWNDKKARKISLLMERPLPFWLKKLFFWFIMKRIY